MPERDSAWWHRAVSKMCFFCAPNDSMFPPVEVNDWFCHLVNNNPRHTSRWSALLERTMGDWKACAKRAVKPEPWFYA